MAAAARSRPGGAGVILLVPFLGLPLFIYLFIYLFGPYHDLLAPIYVYLLCLLELGYLGERQGERIGRHVAKTPL